MAEKYFPFRSVSGDRKYSAEDWAAYFAQVIGNGVFYSAADKLKVVVGEGMTVKVSQGAAFINGRMYMAEDAKTLTLGTADGVFNRIDRIVVRCDYTSRKISTEVIKGSYAAIPTAPDLTRSADVYELALADIYVAAGAIEIKTANITDQRLNTSLCGVVTGLIEQADTEGLLNEFTAYMESLKDEWETEFNVWFEEIKSVLDEEVATQLANRLLALEDGTTPAGTATKLAEARTIQTNLGSAAAASFDGTENATPGVSGILPVGNGGTGNATGLAASATKLATARTIQTNLASTATASFDGTGNAEPGVKGILPAANGGTGNTTGLAASATKLATARTIQTNLGSTAAASFDGTGNAAPGVTGTLPIANGGTGATTAAAALTKLGTAPVVISATAPSNTSALWVY